MRVSDGLLSFGLLRGAFLLLLSSRRFVERYSLVFVSLFLIRILDSVLAVGFLTLNVWLIRLIFKDLLLLLRLFVLFLLPSRTEDLLSKFRRVLLDVLHQLRRLRVIILFEILFDWIETMVLDTLPMTVGVHSGFLHLPTALILPLLAYHSVWVVVLGTLRFLYGSLLLGLSFFFLSIFLDRVNLIIH